MFEKDEKELCKEVAELECVFASSKKELTESRAKLEELNLDLEHNTARLTSVRREDLVSEKKVKDTQNEILVFKGKLSRMGDDVNLLEKESQTAETKLQELAAEKQDLIDSIARIESEMRETIDSIDSIDNIETKRQELLSGVKMCETEKAKLSEEISEFLSGASLKKEAIEAELNDLAINLADRIGDRDHVRDLLAESKKVAAELRGTIKWLDEKRLLLEEVKEMADRRAFLTSDIDGMKGDALSSSQRKEDLQKALSDKKEELNMLSNANAESKDAVTSLEERAGRYEELSQRAADAEKRLAGSGILIDQAISEVGRFVDNTALVKSLSD